MFKEYEVALESLFDCIRGTGPIYCCRLALSQHNSPALAGDASHGPQYTSFCHDLVESLLNFILSSGLILSVILQCTSYPVAG